MNSFLFFIGLVSGFIIPGYLTSKYFRLPNQLISSFVLSLLILYNCIFWTGLVFPLTFVTVLIPLTLISIIFLILNIRDGNNILNNDDVKFNLSAKTVLISTPFAITLLVIFIRSSMQPFHKCDGDWRWNFLAEKLFYLKSFAFYPPFKAEDFYNYCQPDGLPPLISFSYFWLYSSFGQPEPFLTAFFIAGQFLLTGVFCYLTSKNLFPESKYTPYFALTCLAASPLISRAFIMGQDTGLTALSMTGMIYYITSVKTENDFKNIFMAGLCASAGALSREYGGAFAILGAFILLTRKSGVKSLIVFMMTTVICVAPWYIRNWIITENPLYPHPLGSIFTSNDVFIGIMEYYGKEYLPVNSTSQRYFILKTLILNAPVQIFLGLAICFIFFKRLLGIFTCIIIVFILWIYSINQCC